MSFTPDSLSDTLFDQVPKQLRVLVTPTQEFQGAVFVQVRDTSGMLDGGVEVTQITEKTYSAVLKIRPLAVGRYRGQFEVRLCKDSACSEQHTDATKLPYDLEVRSHTQLSALTPLSVPEWTTLQGNNAHSGYVPVILDAARFSPRWLWKPYENAVPYPPVLSAGRAYVALSGASTGPELIALDEASATTLWRQSLGSVYQVNPPVVADGKVFLASSGHESTAMWGFDAANGAQLFRTPFRSQWDYYLNPVVHEGKLYTEGGYYGGMHRFDATTGAIDWFFELNQYSGWSPTIANDRLMVSMRPSHTVTGTYGPYKTGLTEVSFDGDFIGYTDDNRDAVVGASGMALNYSAIGTVVAADNGQTAVVNGASLTRYDVGGGIAWQIPGNYIADPAVAGSELFCVRDRKLEVRNLLDGSLLWSWSPESTPIQEPYGYSPIVTQNLVFFATDAKIYAISRSSHQPVWSYPMSGGMALSRSGILYVQLAGLDQWPLGFLAAINVN